MEAILVPDSADFGKKVSWSLVLQTEMQIT
jgi:hypothetical protein